MPRFIVERTFPDGLKLPLDKAGAEVIDSVLRNNVAKGVFWLHSYVTVDMRKSYCIFDAPSADAIREVAAMNNLPIDSILQDNVLDPHFYRS
jgi:hypothetical protein